METSASRELYFVYPTGSIGVHHGSLPGAVARLPMLHGDAGVECGPMWSKKWKNKNGENFCIC